MTCYIVGYQHLSGVSKKTKEPYDFYKVSTEFEVSGYVGTRVAEVNANPEQVHGIESLQLPVSAELTRTFSGALTVTL